ncbi:pyruvate/ketoisovalerate ferredoxin oxidoreductase subunit gamma [Luedemannella flava]|uniref:Pyruvate/ketoisovalerate ferredoxin oxidoreductase subunit gamma n=1 Tax=Luedemannella flava TaxID=349316 RepID=A0ABN2LCF6_9ACTN
MFQVRIHGRGGQATHGMARLLVRAAALDGWHAHLVAGGGPHRAGDPAVAHVELSVRPRTPAPFESAPDAVLVQDETLLYGTDVLAGLRRDGLALLNSASTWQQLGFGDRVAHLAPMRALAVPATRLTPAGQWPGATNAALLGAFVAATGLVTATAMAVAISRAVAARAAADHVLAARRGREHTVAEIRRLCAPLEAALR